jgi:hypothetical protein
MSTNLSPALEDAAIPFSHIFDLSKLVFTMQDPERPERSLRLRVVIESDETATNDQIKP